jgi:hypothetical protein
MSIRDTLPIYPQQSDRIFIRIFLLKVEVHKIDSVIELNCNIFRVRQSALLLVLQQNFSWNLDIDRADVWLYWKLDLLFSGRIPFLQLKLIVCLYILSIYSHHFDSNVSQKLQIHYDSIESKSSIQQYFAFFTNYETLLIVKVSYIEFISFRHKVNINYFSVVYHRYNKLTILIVLGIIYECVIVCCEFNWLVSYP